MPSSDAPALLHVVGYLTGASLFAMLLTMVVRRRGPGARLTLVTALLGIAWNLGELSAHALERLHFGHARDWVAAVSYAAFGFLAAVVVHSAGGGPADRGRRISRYIGALGWLAYVCAGISGVLQLMAASAGAPLPSVAGLILLTVGIALLSLVLLLTMTKSPHGRRVGWTIALALFAVSALHLVRFHGASEGWATELLGHHASIPLAFAILYQDYRFAFADLFLKRALTLVCLVAVVLGAWSALGPSLLGGVSHPIAVGALLAAWIGTALMFPFISRAASTIIDRMLLKRANYSRLVEDVGSAIQQCETEAAVLAAVCGAIEPALNADAVTCRTGEGSGDMTDVPVLTAEAPHYRLAIGTLAGGRRLLSDDVMMLERVAGLAGRRIDGLRLGEERYERMLREREIGALATEAELRALRAQINPHFLFNALTTLGYLIQHAPSRALDTLMRLTTLLRSVLRSEGEFTTLRHERELIECYLEIERERFEERLDTQLDIPPAIEELTIPSLIIQPLVENAIKHGIAHARHGGHVRIAARVHLAGEARQLRIAVSNTGAPLRHDAADRQGIGLWNVERRLQCYYGDAATVTLRQDPGGETVAELILPLGDPSRTESTVLVERGRR